MEEPALPFYIRPSIREGAILLLYGLRQRCVYPQIQWTYLILESTEDVRNIGGVSKMSSYIPIHGPLVTVSVHHIL